MKITPLLKSEAEKLEEDDVPVVVEDEKILTVSEMFAGTKDYQKGDPLTWEFVTPIIEQLREQGLTLPKNAELQPMFLSEGDLFYKMLSTRMGKSFFKDLSKYPESIDRAERYLSLPDGRKELQFIITRKGGAEFFTDMVNNQNGRETARMISSNPGDQKFDQPTGRIYLESQLIDYLTNTSVLANSSAQPVEPPRPRKYD
ncbi:hypothetical protein OAK91_02155 [Planctomycetaceae bacterium]|nr:hypothetical protein [Planctomycetaceae bacterium]